LLEAREGARKLNAEADTLKAESEALKAAARKENPEITVSHKPRLLQCRLNPLHRSCQTPPAQHSSSWRVNGTLRFGYSSSGLGESDGIQHEKNGWERKKGQNFKYDNFCSSKHF